MLRKMGISAFFLAISITQAFAETHGDESLHSGAAHEHGESATHAVEHASSGLPQLDPSSYIPQGVWLIGVFIVMYVFFSKKTIPQFSRTIENRIERITGDLDTAGRLKNEIAELQKSYEEKIAGAKEESFVVFMNTETEIKETAERNAAEFQDYSARKVKELEKNIEKACDSALQEMSNVAADVAMQASEKIIGVKADKKLAKDIVDSLNKAA